MVKEAFYLDIKGVAKTLGISKRKAFELIHDRCNPIPHYRIGRKIVRIAVPELHEWMRGHKADDQSRIDRIVNEVLG